MSAAIAWAWHAASASAGSQELIVVLAGPLGVQPGEAGGRRGGRYPAPGLREVCAGGPWCAPQRTFCMLCRHALLLWNFSSMTELSDAVPLTEQLPRFVGPLLSPLAVSTHLLRLNG